MLAWCKRCLIKRHHWHWSIKAVLNVLMHWHCKYWAAFLEHLGVSETRAPCGNFGQLNSQHPLALKESDLFIAKPVSPTTVIINFFLGFGERERDLNWKIARLPGCLFLYFSTFSFGFFLGKAQFSSKKHIQHMSETVKAEIFLRSRGNRCYIWRNLRHFIRNFSHFWHNFVAIFIIFWSFFLERRENKSNLRAWRK